MAKSPPQKCTQSTRTGKPCRAWAIRGSNPPTCATHAGRTKDAGAPLANVNRQAHGFYSAALDPNELADLVAFADDLSLNDEIALARVILRRVMIHLKLPVTDRPAEQRIDDADLARLAGLVLAGTRTVARLLRDQRALSGDAADGFAGAIAQALDELSTEIGLQL
jgi:hypothetical protein